MTRERGNIQAVGYIRVSTEEQKLRGYSLGEQRRTIEESASRLGMRVGTIFEDGGVSGTLENRPGLDEALATARSLAANGEDVALVVVKLDRLARDLLIQEKLIEDLNEAGVRFLSVTEPDLDSTDPTRVLVRQMLGAIAQYERSQIVQRMKSGRTAKARVGGYAGGRPPFGYRAAEGALVVEESEAKIVRLIFRLRKSGKTLEQVAGELNGAKIATARGGRKWRAGTIGKIVSNPIYIGETRYALVQARGQHEALVQS